MRKIGGKTVSEEHVDAWVAEAEEGYNVQELKRLGRPGRGATPSQVVPVRLTAEELAALMARAARENLNRSEAIRKALNAWVTAG